MGWAPSLPSQGPSAALTVPLGHLESKEGGGGGGDCGMGTFSAKPGATSCTNCSAGSFGK